LAVSYLNLATLGNANIDPAVVGGVAPTWAAGTGWIFNGLSQYLQSGIIALTTTYSIIIQFTGGIDAVFQCLAGAYRDAGGNASFALYNRHFLSQVAYENGSIASFALVPPRLDAGSLALANKQGYRNGVSDGGAIPAGIPTNPQQVYVGAMNYNGGAIQFFTGNMIALAIYNVTLTAPQVLARATAMSLL
jgi:hypothetical protein